MAAAASMPDMKSGRLIQLSELGSWAPDEVHGNSIRVVGRVRSLNAATSTIQIEYHNCSLDVNGALLSEFGGMRVGRLFQFLGELHQDSGQMVLKARLCHDMAGLDSDLYDRCLRIRQEFENRVLTPRD